MSTFKTLNHLYSNPLCSSSRIRLCSPILFVIYSAGLYCHIYNSAANHHLYADDTQLPLLFSALISSHFSHNITHLENTVTNVFNCMFSNFMSLNPSLFDKAEEISAYWREGRLKLETDCETSDSETQWRHLTRINFQFLPWDDDEQRAVVSSWSMPRSYN